MVELDGDEMTRIIWKLIKETLILPHVDVNLEYMTLASRTVMPPTTRSRSIRPTPSLKHGVGVKCATITPDEARVKEFNLKKMWLSPMAPSGISWRHHFPRPDRHLQHSPSGTRLDQADHHRPARLR